MSLAASLFVSTYEMPKHLELVLSALGRQSCQDFELLICDDGSGAETRAIIERFKPRAPFPVEHLWQENKGFRKCRILNQALSRSQGRVAVFLDGDCVPHRDYMRDHIEHQESGRFLAGRRVEVGEKLSQRLTPAMIESGYFDYPKPSLLFSDSENLQRSLRVAWSPLRKLLKMERVDDLKGCNYSVARDSLVAINGFDEEYEGYGREDTDVELRLTNMGLKIKSMKGLAIQFHIWHPRRGFTPANDSRLEEVRRTGRVRCERGLDRFSS